SEINAELGLPKPTIHRLFKTLEDEGFLQRDIDGRSFAPGRRTRRMAANAMSALNVRTARRAIMTRLSEEIGETCNLAIPDRDEMVYLDRVETKWPLRIQLPVGTRVPLHCTASGKAYLSSLRPSHLHRYLDAANLEQYTAKTLTAPDDIKAEVLRIRKRGLSTDNEEFMSGMTAIARPILDDQHRLVATISVHAPVQRISLDKLLSYSALLEEAASALASLLQGTDAGD
ncbi:MAG: IclR family transcriptional regulator, partial [Pseudomonadota bacterium]